MKISPSQQQLLNILNIPLLRLHTQFGLTDASVISAATDSQTEIDLHSPLAQDIAVILGDLDWQMGSTLSHSYIQQQTLYTPALEALRTSQLKQQLWRVLADSGNTQDISQADAGAD